VLGGIDALARSLAIEPVPDRARFMLETTRLVYESGEIRLPSVAAFVQTLRQAPKGKPVVASNASKSDLVPVPLTAEIWSEAILHRRIAREELVHAIVADRQAAWLCHGLAQLDDETLEFLAARPNLLSRLYERSAPLVAAFAASVHVRDNRVVPPSGPGGDDATALWEAVVGEKTTRADRFIASLFDASDGRLAYVYDTIAQLDAPHRAFALGSWMPSATARLDRFRAFVTTTIGGVREWHARALPFSRSSYDLGMALTRIQVDARGVPVPPTDRALWTRILGNAETQGQETPIDAAWIAENIVSTDVRQRGDRLDQIGFAQRVFAGRDLDRAELAFVLRSLPRFRALLLTFERIGIDNLGVYAAVIRHAARVAGSDGRRGYVAQAQLQGGLALLARMAAVGTIDRAGAEHLVEELIAMPYVDGAGYGGGVSRWIRERLYPKLPAARDFEGAVIAGLAGPAPAENTRRVIWEGQRYRLDLPAAERNRLTRVREKQGAPPLDIPMQMAEAARTLGTDSISTEELEDIATQFAALARDLPQRTRDDEADNVPPGVSPPSPVTDTLQKAASEILKAIKNKDAKRAARLAPPVVEAADDLLARNLLSFAYAISLGDPDGTVLLADDVSHRHDFGFALKDADMRARIAWSVPRQEVAPGVSWHVTGSLLALDVGLATLKLRRVATDHVLEAPKLSTNVRDAFATSIALMDPRVLTDGSRDAIADAIGRGRQRAQGITAPRDLDSLAAQVAVDSARTRAMQWTLTHEPERLPSLFSLTELLTLGGGDVAAFQPWGMSVVPTSGCLCARLLPPGAWPVLTGRPQLGLAAAVLPDLSFRVAIVLKDLDLPAALAPVVLAAAMQDFIDEARPTDDSDWLSLSRAARDVPRERIEDYIAAATATGPLMPEASRELE
jgi:hypothetical protein